MTRRFEFAEGASSKFWEITEDGSTYTVRYGRIGTAGQTQTKAFGGEAEARAAAAKLIAEKTGKGYTEVGQATAPEQAPAETPKPKKAEAPKKAEKAEKAEAREVPPFTLMSGKSLGARALANAAERLSLATTDETWNEAVAKISYSDHEIARVLVHLLTHGLFVPTTRLQVARCAPALLRAPPEVALRVLSALSEPQVELLRTELPPALAYLPVVARLHRLAPEALRATALPPTLHALALLAPALGGEALSPAEGDEAVAVLAALLPYDVSSLRVVDAAGTPTALGPEALAATLERLRGDRWIRTFPTPGDLPAEVVGPALRGEALEEVGRALSWSNREILDARTEAPARFFEVAATLAEQPAGLMRAAGIRRAAHPDEIPVGGEDLLAPNDVSGDPGFCRLGEARLDAWAGRWLARFPAALTTTDATDEAFGVGAGLRRLALDGAPFGDALRRALIGVPQPYEHAPDQIDVRTWFGETSSFSDEGARALIPWFARRAREHEGEVARGLRLALAAAVRSLPAGEDVPEEVDALLSLGDPVDHDSERAVHEAVQALPAARAERVVLRTAHLLTNRYAELATAREGASAVAVRRLARLVAAGREDPSMWDAIRGGELAILGPAFGPALAEALAGEALSDSFFERLGRAIDPDALAHLRAAVGQNVLDLAGELRKLAADVGGPRVTVYALSPAAGSSGLHRIGGRPAGFAPEDIPRHRGRKLAHAFTVDLADVPELAARYPGARTLSVWVQGYSEDPERAQALLTRSDTQVAALPGEGGGALALLRLEVPAAAFDRDPPDRAGYAQRLLYQRPGFLLGGPVWLQTGRWGLDASFLGQYDERLAPSVNLGDAGVCYAFADRAEWQCH